MCGSLEWFSDVFFFSSSIYYFGCSDQHLPAFLYNRIIDLILSSMEGGKSAAVLLGVDYKKTFNRMEHSVCIQTLSRLGASDGSIALVCAFLKERSMTIIEGHRAPSVPLLRGSSQGSVLGCLIYCTTRQLLTSDLRADRAAEGGGPEAFLSWMIPPFSMRRAWTGR